VYADISEIIKDNGVVDNIEDSLTVIDTSQVIITEKKIDTVRANTPSLKKKVYPIEYPSGNKTVLLKFFKELDATNKKRVRILHYGDSQLEGDRITGYLRNQFQRRFGGSGPGLMPTVPAKAESASIIQKASRNWSSYSAYYKKDTIIGHRQFGVLGSFSRFTGYYTDSTLPDNITKAWVKFRRSGMAYSSVNNYTECRIFYGHYRKNGIVKGYVNDKLVWFEEPEKTEKTQVIEWEFEKSPTNFKIEFEGIESPDIYGISLDAKKGIAVDNLPFRGSSGTEFSKINYEQFSQMASYFNTGLIIIEFGVNVVPYQTKSYKFFQRALTRELRFLKKVYKNTPILVIGVSDMSQRKGNYYESYPNIEKILEAQRMAAQSEDCAFWDLYHAMGGHNSMPGWVFANPPLARKDFTHFNRKGGHIVAQMLFNALMDEYGRYKISKQKK
jgi:lysophospholipase L1-like esterase